MVPFLQALQDGRFAPSEIYVAGRGLHVQNRPDGCIIQRSSTQKSPKIRNVSLGREVVPVPVPMLWYETSSNNIHKKRLKAPISVLRHLVIRVIIYLNDLLILGNSMSQIFMARDSEIFLLQHLGFVINREK